MVLDGVESELAALRSRWFAASDEPVPDTGVEFYPEPEPEPEPKLGVELLPDVADTTELVRAL